MIMQVCTYVCKYKSIDVSKCVCIVDVCMHVHMYGDKNSYIYMHVGKNAQAYFCL